MTNDETILLTKEYQLNSPTKSKELFKNFIDHPDQYLCTRIEVKENIIYGYHEDTLTTLIFQKEKVSLLYHSVFNYQHNNFIKSYNSINNKGDILCILLKQKD